jgi:hypothetical protein
MGYKREQFNEIVKTIHDPNEKFNKKLQIINQNQA